MKTLRQTALLAGSIVFLTVMASKASCQEGLQPVDAQPGHLQAVPEASGDEDAAAGESSQSCTNGGDHQGSCDCGSSATCGRPRGLIGTVPGLRAAAAHGSSSPFGQCEVQLPGADRSLGASRLDRVPAGHDAILACRILAYGMGSPRGPGRSPDGPDANPNGLGRVAEHVTPIYHQFERPYPSAMTADGTAVPGMCLPLYPTPRWPSHTDQFGVYYVRSPW